MELFVGYKHSTLADKDQEAISRA